LNLYDKGWLAVNGNRYNNLGMRYTILGWDPFQQKFTTSDPG